jgi:cell division protein FtsQ
VVRLGLEAQNAIRRARGQPELDAEGNPIDKAAIAKANKNSKKI